MSYFFTDQEDASVDMCKPQSDGQA